MDSLTQIVLGASVGELALGKKLGNKAQLVGAIAGTIPDLDVFLNFVFDSDLFGLLVHRSYSHALPVHVVLALLPAWISYKLDKKKLVSFKLWYLTWFLGLSTHAILDAFTAYGTRLFLPFTDYQVGFNNISVINLGFTLPFLVLTAICLFLKRTNPKRIKFAKAGMYYALLFMSYTLLAKLYVHNKFERELKAQNIVYNHLYTGPTMFNGVLWYGMAVTDSMMYTTEYSFFQDTAKFRFAKIPRHLEYEKGFEGKGLKTLKWFSQGKYVLNKTSNDTLDFYVVKWGRGDFRESEPKKAFVFYYRITGENLDEIEAVRPDFDSISFKEFFQPLYDRIFKY